MIVPDDQYVEAMRVGVKLANSRGVTAVHDKDGWLGALRLWQQLEERGQLSLRVWQSIPHDKLEHAVATGLRSGFGSSHVKLGYLKVFMDGTLGSQTAWMLDGSGVQITSGERAGRDRAARRRCGLPGRGARDRRPRQPRSAGRIRGDAGPLAAARACGSGSSTRSCSPPRISPASPSSASPAPCSSRTLRRIATWRIEFWAGKTDGAYAFRSLLDSGAVLVNGSDAPIEELDPLAGIRAGVRRTIDERAAWHPEQCVTVDQAFHATCVAPAWLARRRTAPRHADPGPRGRSGRARPRSVGRPGRRGGRDHGRRPLGAQPAALVRFCVRFTR